ncbi:MAG: hypothetical protein RLW87_20685 [Alphaproteobacteria bacterium]
MTSTDDDMAMREFGQHGWTLHELAGGCTAFALDLAGLGTILVDDADTDGEHPKNDTVTFAVTLVTNWEDKGGFISTEQPVRLDVACRNGDDYRSLIGQIVEAALIAKHKAYCASENLPHVSADALLLEEISDTQRKAISRFILVWEDWENSYGAAAYSKSTPMNATDSAEA